MIANNALSENGDITNFAGTMWESGTEAISNSGVQHNMNIMDVVCGDDTTAVPTARLGLNIPGVDNARNLVAAGNKCVQDKNIANGLHQEGGTSALSKHDADAFDLVLSILGATMIW